FGILRVVVVERARQPHRRPQVVGLVAHDQLEHALVEAVVGAAKAGLAPAAQRGILVVDEDAAVAHLRRVDEAARGDMQAAALRWRHVRPPGPRRDADAARKLVQAVGRAATVGAYHQQRAVDAGLGPVDDLQQVGLPHALYATGINPVITDDAIDARAVAQGTGDDRQLLRAFGLLLAGDRCQVATQGFGRALHRLEIALDHPHRQRRAAFDQDQAAGA